MSNNLQINMQALAKITQFCEGSKGYIQAVHKESLKEVARRLIEYTPIGNKALWKQPGKKPNYTPGHLKANWQLGREGRPTGEVSDFDTQGSMTLKAMESNLGRWTFGHKFYFVNNAPYAYVIEAGAHSQQVGPGGMVGRVRREWKQIVRQSAEKVKSTGMWKNAEVL